MNQTMNGQLKHQSGVALIIGLVMLLLLTIIMLAAMRVTSLEEKMAGNLRNQNIAFQAAESALREAEARIAYFGGKLPACLKHRFDDVVSAECQAIIAQDLDDNANTIDWDGNGEEVEINPFFYLKESFGLGETCSLGLCGDIPPIQLASLDDLLDGSAMMDASSDISTTSDIDLNFELKYLVQVADIHAADGDDVGGFATFLITAVARDTGRSNSLVVLQSTYRLYAVHWDRFN